MRENIESFNKQSGQYAQSRPKYPAEFFQYLVSQLETRETLWDCACGNGQVAIDLADDFEEVYATDISENQINNAFSHERIHYQVMSSEKTNFPDQFFDMICVAQALHWFNIEDFFEEADRVLKQGGILTCFNYGFFTIEEEIDKIIEEYLFKPIENYWSDRNWLAKSGYKSVKFPFQKIDAPYFDMIQSWNCNTLLNYLRTWSAVKRYNEYNNDNIIGKLNQALNQVWAEQDIKQINMVFNYHIRRKIFFDS